MSTYVKLVNGQLEYPTNNTLSINGCDCMQEVFTAEQYLQAGFKLLVKAKIVPPLLWFQQATITYAETETEVKEAYVVVAIESVKANCESHYNSICNMAILTGFIFEDRNLWLTAETQQNITTDYFDSVTMPEMQEYPKYYKFSDGMVVFENLDRLKLLFRTMKNFVSQQLAECWYMKFQNIENQLDPLTDEQIYALLIDRYAV